MNQGQRRDSGPSRKPRSSSPVLGSPISIRQAIKNLLAPNTGGIEDGSCLRWPPDAFAICASFLQFSGAYTCAEKMTLSSRDRSRKRWPRRTLAAGKEWRRSLEENPREKLPPEEVLGLWRVVLRNLNQPIDEVGRNEDLAFALLSILVIADAVSVGIEVPSEQQLSPTNQFLIEANAKLTADLVLHRPTNLCQRVGTSRAVVLPKMRTPQSGLTLRSFSHHLAFVQLAGVGPKWISHLDPSKSRTNPFLNLVLIPWPPEILPKQFERVEPSDRRDRGAEVPVVPKGHGFFRFRPRPIRNRDLTSLVQICRRAQEMVGEVDGLIFPELSMRLMDYRNIIRRLEEAKVRVPLIVAGLWRKRRRNLAAGNSAKVRLWHPLHPDGTGGEKVELEQHKHHRWFLDRSQICQYGLGSRLQTDMKWWEHTSLENRSLHFLNLKPWLTLTVVICEDLARPDPAGDLIRAVGPNLVIALLLDGPQLSHRWPARSATVLADDPGSSVLTLTSLGMAKLSRPPAGAQESRSIALWRAQDSDVRELELPPGADAIVLSLANNYREQWSADGRSDRGTTGCIGLAGIHAITGRAGARGPGEKSPGGASSARKPGGEEGDFTLRREVAGAISFIRQARKNDRVKVLRKYLEAMSAYLDKPELLKVHREIKDALEHSIRRRGKTRGRRRTRRNPIR
jgi:hypothetical protein